MNLNLDLWPQQAKVFTTEAQEVFYGGAAGGGKSHLARIASIIWALSIPGIQIYFFRRQFVDLELNHLNGPTSFLALLAPLLDSGHCTWHKGKYQFVFANGSSIKLCHVQKDSDQWNYLGAEIHILIVDELSQFTPAIYRFLRSRVRMVGIEVPEGVAGRFPKILACSNPGGPCHSYMKSAWVKAAPPETVWRAAPEEGGLSRVFIPARIYDNPSLLEGDPEYINRLRGLGDEAMVKAYLEGSFDVVSGGMFDDLYDPNKHLVDPFPVPSSWHINRAFDMGTSRPFCVSWFAESDGTGAMLPNGVVRYFPAGSIFQIGEWYGWNGKYNEGSRLTPVQIADGIKATEANFGRKVHVGPADPSIWNADAHGFSVANTMLDNGVEWYKADNKAGSRAAGWVLVRTMLKNTIDGIDQPHLYLFKNCIHTARTLQEAVRGQTNTEDLLKESEDHALDTLRYRIQSGILSLRTSDFRPF